MSLVEKEITMQNVERARSNAEFEKRREIEQKLVPRNPELLETLFKPQGMPVEQIYLSTPEDEFSIRVRCAYGVNGPEYTATQKDRGEMRGSALERSEITTEISPEAYTYYQSMDLPRLHKLRAEITEGVTVDFYDDKTTPVIVEVEHLDPQERAQLVTFMQELTDYTLVDNSSNAQLTNEALAYKNKGEAIQSPESLDSFTTRVLKELVAHYASGKNQVVVGLTGMSGSGKTTVTRTLQERVVELFGEQYKPVVISTDDYHFGKTALEARYGAPYSAWDHPQTYDTTELARNLKQLVEGVSLIKRHFDFDTEEVVFDEELAPSPFVIIEGLYAGSKDLEAVRDLHFELPTGLATSIGRDVRRLIIDNRANRAFPTPESRLRYQIETAAPLYLSQERPNKNSFSASTRTMGERAFMLARLSEL